MNLSPYLKLGLFLPFSPSFMCKQDEKLGIWEAGPLHVSNRKPANSPYGTNWAWMSDQAKKRSFHRLFILLGYSLASLGKYLSIDWKATLQSLKKFIKNHNVQILG